jgi:uncharacterized membrane protein YagU involved in acid resistance
VKEIVDAKLRGVIGAMAMTGLRVFAVHAGLIREDPPSRLVRKRRGRRPRWLVELVHWAMGGVFGIGFALLPERIRRRPWSGPLYGLVVWLGFDAVVAPALGLNERDWPKGRERAVFVADHLVFGAVLGGGRHESTL